MDLIPEHLQFLPDNIINVLKKKQYADNSIKTFNQSMKKVFKLMYGPEQSFDMKMLTKDAKKVIKVLATKDIPLISRKAYYMAMGVMIEILGLKNAGAKELLMTRNIIASYNDYNRVYECKEPPIPLQDIYNQVNDLYNEYKEKLTDDYNPRVDISFLILSFFKHLPPLRAQDYINTIITEKSIDDDNHINLTTEKMVIYDHKTRQTYGTKIIKLPKDLVKDIKYFYSKTNSVWLIPSPSNIENNMNNVTFTQFLNRLFKNKISTTQLRRAYVSQKIINEDMKGNERKKIAEIMGHDVKTQNTIYSCYSKIAG